ncbi:hypothetical protein [Oceanicaulis sp. HTCC2633]|uniref:hypothetical protein n=1 Tax=Oceanicaulis sp. HTCC2633 TaxID=314254 RepID=UPI000323EFD9|nr:hypothetical protein [Oceanicaulis sp. HTCC2633]
MKLVQLLTGAATAALLAGVATAQEASVAGNLGENTQFASEFDGAIADNTVITVDTDASGTGTFDNLGAASVVDVTITLNNLRFTRVLANTDFDPGVDAANCTFAIQSGGGSQGTSVVVRNDSSGAANLNACGNDNTWTLPVERVAAGAASMTINYNCTADCGTFAAANESYNIVIEADAYPTAGRAVNAGTTATVNANGIGPASSFDLGEVDFQFRDAFDFNNAGPVEDINVDGGAAIAQITATDAVASASLVVTFPQGTTGIATVAATGVAGACVEDATAGTFTCPVTAAELAALDGVGNGVISFTPDNTDAISAQTPTAAINVTANTGYAVSGLSAGALAAIDRDDGLNTDVPTVGNAFEWVSVRSSGGTNNAFRVTGLPTDLSATGACIEVQATDTNTTIANSGWNCISGANVVASANNTWTATFDSADLNAALGAGEGNADIQLRVRRADTINSVAQADGNFNGQINIRRLLSRNNIVVGTGFDG